ncbi:MAG: ABC transporter ATP-binding protein [Candidatus Nanoarchaeia archaeon]
MKEKEGKIDFKYNLKLYFKYLLNYKGWCIGLLFLILLIQSTAVLETYLFKKIIDKGTAFVAKTITLETFINVLILIAAIYICMSLAKAVFKYLYLHFINKLETGVITDLKRKFFNHLIYLDHNFFVTHKIGGLISKLIRIGGAVERLTDVLIFNFSQTFFRLVVVSFSLFLFSWHYVLITLLVATIFIIYSLVMQRVQEKSNIESNNAEDLEKASISDIFTNVDSIKYFGKEELIKLKYKKLSEISKNKLLRFWNYFRWMDSIQGLIVYTGTFLLVYFAVKDFINGNISIGSLVFINGVYGGFISELFGFVHGIRGFYRSMADFETLFRYDKVTNEIKDKPNAKELKIKHGDLAFNNLTFKYGTRTIFKNLNLKVHKNKKFALVGHSGSGKTTLVKLLYRFYDVNAGEILVDGKNINEFKQESLRSEMSIVPQECLLFDDTIYNNIAFSNPKAPRKQVLQAIKFAQLDKIIKSFPYKEKTIVGERGIKLSGGEKQRVSIARAILANKKILVLDEATSSLDSQTEHEIQAALRKLMKGRTSIIIAHRLSTIMNADRIIVLDKGNIVQRGTHNQLIKQKGPYKKLWSLQKGGYIK